MGHALLNAATATGPHANMHRYMSRYEKMPYSDDVIPAPVYYAEWIDSIVPLVGQVPAWLSNSGATYTPRTPDNYGIWRYCNVAEARFWGCRREENLLPTCVMTDAAWVKNGTATVATESNDLDILEEDGVPVYLLTCNGTSNSVYTAITKNDAQVATGVLRPHKHTVAFRMKGGTATSIRIQLYYSGEASPTSRVVTLSTTEWKTFSLTHTPDGTNAYRVLLTSTTAGTFYVHPDSPRLFSGLGRPEDANGNIPPAEEVSRGRITYVTGMPAPYHGAMVDGVKYFRYAHANTVDNTTGEVTFAKGADYDDDSLWGLIHDYQTTAIACQSLTLSSWTINGGTSLAVTTNQGTGIDGTNTCVKLTEDLASTVKYAYLDVASSDNLYWTVQGFVKSSDLTWMSIGVIQKNGTTVRQAFFNLATGVVGTKSTGVDATILSGFVNDLIWISATLPVGAGGSNPRYFIRMANADNAAIGTAHTGTGRALLIDAVQIHNKEHPVTPIVTVGSNLTRTGCNAAIDARGMFGRNDIVMAYEKRAFYRSGLTNKTIDGSSAMWYYDVQVRAEGAKSTYNRFGVTMRPYFDAAAGHATYAIDRYLGEPTSALKWKPNTRYEYLDVVVPTDTQANNANSKKAYVNNTVGGGVSGASEPSWNTSGSPPPANSDGTISWIANGNIRDNGNYDPNDGYHLNYQLREFVKGRNCVWYSRDKNDPMGFVINGNVAEQTTTPFPVDKSEFGDLHEDMGEIRIGRNTSNGTSPSNYAFSSFCIRNFGIWDRQIAYNTKVAMGT